MKRNLKWVAFLLLVLIIAVLLIFPLGKTFALPFAAEEVSSVIIWSFWGYKETEEAEEIAVIMEQMNNIRLCGEFSFEDYEAREGDYGCDFYFFLKDGRTYEYSTLPKPGLTSVFQDADGIYYKARRTPQYSIMDKLSSELLYGNPFSTQ